MLRFIDEFINKITMYKLVLYSLAALILYALVLTFFGLLPYKPTHFLFSLTVIVFACYVSNKLISKFLDISANVESSYITAFILFLLFLPSTNVIELYKFALVGLMAMCSKYLITIGKSHIFNPAALGATLGSMILDYPALWWVGSGIMLPLVVVVTYLIIRKTKKEGFALLAMFSALTVITYSYRTYGTPLLELTQSVFLSWPLLFFVGVMLTEPLTMPGSKHTQYLYAILAGILFGSQYHFGPVYSTPENALMVTNLLFALIAPHPRYKLSLKRVDKTAGSIYTYFFEPNKKLKHKAGQYMEWTLDHDNPDSRGIRRYFTIASAPSDNEIVLGIKIMEKSSTFKKKLSSLQPGTTLTVGQVGGSFCLSDHNTKFVFIAGGIGVTPFRSIVNELLTLNKPVDGHLIYICKTENDFVYKEIFEEAVRKIGLRTTYMVSVAGENNLTVEKLQAIVPDHTKYTHFISGPAFMVDSYVRLLKKAGVSSKNIKTDYFPGF